MKRIKGGRGDNSPHFFSKIGGGGGWRVQKLLVRRRGGVLGGGGGIISRGSKKEGKFSTGSPEKEYTLQSGGGRCSVAKQDQTLSLKKEGKTPKNCIWLKSE